MGLFRLTLWLIFALLLFSFFSPLFRASSDTDTFWWRLAHIEEAVSAKIDKKDPAYVPAAQIPLALKQAIVAIEDERFYHHHGIDFVGIARALLNDLKARSYSEGGSTITQQLARNLFLGQEKTLRRKVAEMVLAAQIERHFSKEAILEMYLNRVYFGSGAYGIRAAAEIYFDKPPAALSLAECALLAGLPQAPSAYSPHTRLDSARERQAMVLNNMVRQGFITAGTAERAKKEPLKIRPRM